MAVKFRDYYEILGIKRGASQDDVQRGYRKLARKYHPDVNKAKDAEEKFKEINEAYEVLKDPEKRKMYDQLGPNWRSGQEFRPPPGWGYQQGFRTGGGGQSEFQWGGAGDFSDFFETLFGGRGFQQAYQGGGPGGFGHGTVFRQAGADQETTIRISLEEAFRGGTKPILLQSQVINAQGQVEIQEKRYDVKIPPGILPKQKIRLTGQGGSGSGGGPSGDLYLKVEIEPHPVYTLKARDIYMEVPVTPWEALLGAEVNVETVSGGVTLKIPPGTQSGQKMRLRGKGMPNPKGATGDLYATIVVKVPTMPSPEERRLFEELSKISDFNPRRQ